MIESFIYLQLHIIIYKGDNITTISVSQKNYDRLVKRKTHTRQSFDEAIGNVLDKLEELEKKEND